MKPEFLLVGCGIFNITLARLLTDAGKKVKIIERRSVVGGNAADELKDGILIHTWGIHCFHTNNQIVWDFLNRFSAFNSYQHRVLSKVEGKLHSFPPNTKMFESFGSMDKEAIYNAFFRGYNQKMWGKEPGTAVINRIPWRDTNEDRYFTDRFQGLPVNGYTAMFQKMLDGIEVELNTEFEPERHRDQQVIFTGDVAQLLGKKLPFRSLRFDLKRIESEKYQDVAQVNYPSLDVPFTRSIEFKHLYPDNKQYHTFVQWETPTDIGEPLYPIAGNQDLHLTLKSELANMYPNIIPAGRLGNYVYVDMDQSVAMAMALAKKLLDKN